MADSLSSGGSFRKEVRVQIPPPAPAMPSLDSKSNIIYPIFLILVGLTASFVYMRTRNGIRLELPFFTKTEVVKPILPPAAPAKAKIPVLVYHYVEVVQNKDDFIRRSLAITPATFESHIKSLVEDGYTFYFVRDISDVLTASKAAKAVVLTFDDGYGDFYTDAFPILKKYNVKSTVFINSGLINQPNYMTKPQVLELAKSGIVELGGHGYSHLNLVQVEKALATTTVETDREKLKTDYGVTAVSFCYPYGAYNATIQQIVKNAGYTYGVTLDPGWILSTDNLLAIPRVKPGAAGTGSLAEYLNSLN